MNTKFIFIAGMEKCGTTALSDWFISEGLAQQLVPGCKEPYLFLPYRFWRGNHSPSGIPYLDASAGYALIPQALENIPHHDSKIIICIRNQIERAWSSFKMKKVMALSDGRAQFIFDEHPDLKNKGVNSGIDMQLQIAINCFPRSSSHFVEQYFHQERERLKTSSFLERVLYETAFFMSHGQFPFLSVISGSFYSGPLKSILKKFQPSDVCVLDVDLLTNDENRELFLNFIGWQNRNLPPPKKIFSLDNSVARMEPPDFSLSDYDPIRNIFDYDMSRFLDIVSREKLGCRLLDIQKLGL